MQISLPNNPLSSAWARDDAEKLRVGIETILVVKLFNFGELFDCSPKRIR